MTAGYFNLGAIIPTEPYSAIRFFQSTYISLYLSVIAQSAAYLKNNSSKPTRALYNSYNGTIYFKSKLM